MTGGKNEHGVCFGTLQHHHGLLLPCLKSNMHHCILYISISITKREKKKALKSVCLAYFCICFLLQIAVRLDREQRLDFVTVNNNIQFDSHVISAVHRHPLYASVCKLVKTYTTVCSCKSINITSIYFDIPCLEIINGP